MYFVRWRINNLLLQPPSYMLTQSNQILCLVVLCGCYCVKHPLNNHNNYFFFRSYCSGKNNLIMTYCSGLIIHTIYSRCGFKSLQEQMFMYKYFGQCEDVVYYSRKKSSNLLLIAKNIMQLQFFHFVKYSWNSH